MSPNIPDRRVQRTHKLLQESLMALVAEKGYEAVTVQEILDRANVGRSTFYAHFQDKEQLLHSILKRLNDLLEGHKQQILGAASTAAAPHTARPALDSPTLSLFQFVGEHHRFFKAVLVNRGYGIFAKPIYDYVFAHVHELFRHPTHADVLARLHEPFKTLNGPDQFSSLNSEIAAHYFVSAWMGLVVWWVEHDMPCTADEIDGLFRRLAMPGFSQMFA